MTPHEVAPAPDATQPQAKPNGAVRAGSTLKDYPLLSLPFTDSGNGERLAVLLGHEFRYCAAQHCFYYYLHGVWKRDTLGVAAAAAKGMARMMYRLASKIVDQAATSDDDHDRRELVKRANATLGWALKTESVGGRGAALTCFQSEAGIPISQEDFDRDPYLLNCADGTLDLRNFKFSNSRAEDYLTRQCPVKYDPNARSDVWDQFIAETTGHDPELQVLIQRAAGYSLMGENPEEVLFIAHGPTASGKSTFLEALKATCGSYAVAASTEAFLAKRGGGIPNDLAALKGSRIAIAIEIESGRRLAEALVKAVTGRDTIPVRRLYAEWESMVPQFALWIGTNILPQVNHADAAIWRRIIRVPFTQQVDASKRNPGLKTKLCSPEISGSAILAWAVRGLRHYYEIGGLWPPERVRQATAQYRANQNILAEFVAEKCIIETGGRVPQWHLYRAIEDYMRDRHKPALDTRDIREALKSMSLEQVTVRDEFKGVDKKGNKVTSLGWKGIRMRSTEDDEDAFPLSKDTDE